MARTLTHRRTRKVAEMNVDELSALLEALIDRKLAEWASHPRIARRRAEIAANATRTRAEYRAGQVQRGTAQDLLNDLK